MTSKEIVRASLYFQNPPRYACDFPGKFGTDFFTRGMSPSPDDRKRNGTDEWGCVWSSIANTFLGEVHDYPLKEWEDFQNMEIPDFMREDRWEGMKTARKDAGDKYLMSHVCSIYERPHYLRGLENLWCDILEEPDMLAELIGILTENNVRVINRYAECGCDGIMILDDWGLQDRLMIHPDAWRKIWKPEYKRIFDAAHAAGMDCWMHSCGNILEILDDLIEIGLNAIHMDQQENMGLETLSQSFQNRINFFSPVDIQKTMARGNPDEIRAYARKMANTLGTKAGGFIPRWYTDPEGAGHKPENVDIMCEEFLKISDEVYGCHYH